ncbi:hypothetical protein CIHG_03400 [Coccidioides immitis H538.4]|uniref:Uncharacterized protein n=1 Tax=Coccidioides immitis H538.4 TaxID=396776 RepID=A0A0J8RMQ1_COCIT|nr:hypothetical protein CIHG_03400 [Coccidioides immitis H538.4]
MAESAEVDYTLNNPDTLTKYKTAAQISHKVLEAVTGWCVEGAKILELCEKGDKLLDEEVSKVYKGKKVPKGPYGSPGSATVCSSPDIHTVI